MKGATRAVHRHSDSVSCSNRFGVMALGRSSRGSAARPPTTAAPASPRRWATACSMRTAVTCVVAVPRWPASSVSTRQASIPAGGPSASWSPAAVRLVRTSLALGTLAAALIGVSACGGRESPDDQGLHQDIVNGANGAEVTFDATVLADPVESGGHERFEVKAATGERLEV